MTKSNSFHPAIQNWFTASFKESSPPQEQGWPNIAKGDHTLILAPTGSGKTLAAFLWCIDDLFRKSLSVNADQFEQNPSGVHTLYISPLKALNYDIHRNLELPLQGIREFAGKLKIQPPKIRMQVRTGDTPGHVRTAMVKKPPHILITTPESLYLLITSEKGREIFRDLKYVIVDEIHSLCNNKRGVHLSLSLERLMALCGQEPVRIGLSATQKPLQRIAAFLGGQKYDPQSDQLLPRPVIIVDCGQKKRIDLKVISPVEDFGDLPDASVWPAVYERVYQLILHHKTTLVFVNMRAQTEKIARELNRIHQQKTGKADAEIALAHHGSISREARFEVEQRLKGGQIPAVIATASLELGIDIGSVELVVQLESPRTITSALQRVGRSGHLLHAQCKGRIVPLYPGDLDDSIAITLATLDGEIEESVIPENCLDVLAQQIVAEISFKDWDKDELFNLIRQSYCYRNLSQTVYENVLDMLAGRFADEPLQNLQPRLSWDKVNNRLLAHRGARLQAVMDGGTIPDRGYYGVYLAGKNVKLGEMEEEFVFESKVGDTFYLGNNEWRITDIKNDRIVVSAGSSAQPRPPFWKGGLLFRDYSSQQQVARFRRLFLQDQTGSEQSFSNRLQTFIDSDVLVNVQAYFHRQIQSTGKLADDRQIVIESFRDVVREPYVAVHAPFGARVNGLWAIALNAILEEKYRVQMQYDYDDDAILFRFFNLDRFPDFDELLVLPEETIEKYLLDSLAETPLFSIYFRFNATRALLLRRSRQGQRIPLWMQRLRAADLLQIVRKYPDFPIVLETYRECLHDVFDLKRLKMVIQSVRNGEIAVHQIHTPSPSPMTSGVMFQFLSKTMYDYDQARYPGLAANISGQLLAEILEKEIIPTIVSEDLVEQAKQRWQHLSESGRGKNKEELYHIIEKLGPIPETELRLHSHDGYLEWIDQLKSEKRIEPLAGRFSGWIAATDLPLYINPLFENDFLTPELFQQSSDENKSEIVRRLIKKFLFPRGPVTLSQMSEQLRISPNVLIPILQKLRQEKEVVSGNLVIGWEEEQWCNQQNFAELYRRAVARRRETEASVSLTDFYRFSLRWHEVNNPKLSLIELIRKYRGFKFPIHFFEREILTTRFSLQNAFEIERKIDELNNLISQGEIIITACRSEEGRILIQFFPGGEGAVLFDTEELAEKEKAVPQNSQQVLQFLKDNGASFLKDISAGTGLTFTEVELVIAQLAKSGLVTSDNYPSFLSVLAAGQPKKTMQAFESSFKEASFRNYRRKSRSSRSLVKQKILSQKQKQEGRWFLVRSFAVMGKMTQMSEKDRPAAQARLLLERYGILIKEWCRKEKELLPWYPIFRMLKRLEWQGEIRRGYFIDSLSGLQFSLPEALELLMNLKNTNEKRRSNVVMLSTTDPALPFSGAIDWELTGRSGKKAQIIRSESNHLIFTNENPTVYSENYGSRLCLLKGFEEDDAKQIADCMKLWLKLPAQLRQRKRIEIKQIDSQSASDSFISGRFLQGGFEKEGSKLVLWPSKV